MSRLDELRKQQSSTTTQPKGTRLDRLRANMESEKTKQQMQQFKELTGMKTPIPTAADVMESFKPMTGPSVPKLPGRDIPVVGQILSGLDVLEKNPIRKKIGDIAGALYTPGAGAANLATLTGAAERTLGFGAGRLVESQLGQKALGAANKLLNTQGINISPNLASKVAQKATTEAVVGAPLGAAQYLASQGATGQADLGEAAKQGLYGGLIGGATGGALPLAGAGLKNLAGTKIGQSIGNLIKPISQQKRIAMESAQVPQAESMKGNWFTNLFGKQGVGITPGLQRGRRNLATTEGQIVDQPLRTDIKGVKDQAQAMVRTAYNNQVDFTRPLKYIDEATYETAQDVRRANNLANTTIQDKFVDIQGNVLGPSLKEIGNKVARGEGNAFEDYLILRHAKTRMSRGERVYDEKLNMTPEKVQERINILEQRYPQFSGIANEWDGYNANLLRIGVQEGLISESQRAAMQSENPNYASMRRQFTTAEKYAQPFAMKTKGFSGQKAPIKEVSPTGSVRKIVSPFRSAIEQTGAWYNSAMRNRVMQNIYNKINTDPELLRGIIEIVPDTAEATKKSLDEINDILNTDGMEGLIEKLDGELSVMFRKGGQKGAKTENVVTSMIEGKPVKLRVENPEVFKALVGMGPEESNFVMDIVGSLSKATKYGATGPLAPLFAAKSLTVDVAQAIIQSKNPLAHLYDLTHSIASSIANKLPEGTPGVDKLRELAQDFSRTGGEYSAALMGDRVLQESVGGILRQPYLSPKGLGRIAVGAGKAPFKILNSISDISENVNRMAAYKGALRKQGDIRTPEAIRNAMRESQEITTNFSRKGAKAEGIEKFIPYSNAAVQSIRRFAKQWQENPVKTAAVVGGLVIAPKMYEYSMFSDDPDYQKLPAREKYRNIIVSKNEDGTFNKIPMPPEYNALGASMVDMLVGYKDGDPVNWRQTADAIVNAYTPPWLSGTLQGVTQGGGVEQSIRGVLGSTSIAPFTAISAGKQGQSFTGAPIVPQRLTGVSPEQRYDERTSSIANRIGSAIGLAPLKVDYLIRAYGGDPARLLLPLTAQVGAGTPRNTLLKNFIVDPVFTNTLTNDFYDLKEKITQAKADKSIQGVELPAWYNESVSDYVTNQKKTGISKKLSELTEAKRGIQGNKSLDSKQKADQLRDIQSKMNEIYLDAITRMKESGVPTGR